MNRNAAAVGVQRLGRRLNLQSLYTFGTRLANIHILKLLGVELAYPSKPELSVALLARHQWTRVPTAVPGESRVRVPTAIRTASKNSPTFWARQLLKPAHGPAFLHDRDSDEHHKQTCPGQDQQ